MCAIAGILNLTANEQTVNRMLSSMQRRGPDGKGTYHFEGVHLLHTRLSVVDHDCGSQPMILDRGMERYVIVFNGRLYNGRELRQELIGLGHEFDGRSDAEVMLHAYAQWGQNALEKSNGIFAFAVLEEHLNRVFLARDRIGVKPLFYMEMPGGLLFASEIKTILTHPEVSAGLDLEGVGQLLLLGPGRRPGSGVFHNMKELEPGCCGFFENKKLQITRYWKLRDREHRESLEETAEQVRALLLDAVRRQMEADVPVGAMLSGGLDSSLICVICGREMEKQGKKLKTFSLDYLGNDKYFRPGKFQPNSDTEYIRIMQSALDSHHHWIVLHTGELLDRIADATIARDLPGMADVDTSLLAFCEKIRPHARVVLSGECADEIFGGYPWYRDEKIRQQQGFPWAQNLEQRMGFIHPAIRERLDCKEYVRTQYQDTLAACDILPENSPRERRMKELVNLNFRWFMQTLLDRKDRMCMANGLEARVPFCDYRIAQYLYGVPWEMKDYRGQEKGLLRYAMRDYLPQAILHRKKSPYPKTHAPQYQEAVSDLLRHLLEEKDEPIFQIVDRNALQSLLEHEFTQPWYGQLMTRPQTIVYMLQLNYWLEHYHVGLIF